MLLLAEALGASAWYHRLSVPICENGVVQIGALPQPGAQIKDLQQSHSQHST